MPSKRVSKGGDLKQVKHVLKRKLKNTVGDITKLVQVVSKGDPISLKRKVSVYPPQVRKLLSEIGNEPITDLMVVRAPIQSFVTKLLGVISLGTYDTAVKDSQYDKMFHLALRINDRYILDKQETIKLVAGSPPPNSEAKPVPLSAPQITIQELMDKTREKMGAARFSNYNAKENNCQDFVAAILEANNLLTPELSEFIKQDAKSVFDKMPSITEKLGKFLTDVGAVANRVIEGEGEKKPVKKSKKKKVKSLPAKLPSKLSWKQFVSHHSKGKTFASRADVHANMKRLSVEYKSLKTT